MNKILIVLLVVLIILLFQWIYHAIQYTKTREDSQVRGFIVEYHYQLLNLYGTLSIADLIAISFIIAAGN